MGARLAGHPLRPRLDDPRVPARAGRSELHAGADARLPRGDGEPRDPALAPLPRVRDRRAEPPRVRRRRPEAPRAGRDPRRHDLVHRDERTRRRIRPRRAVDPRRGARRPLRRQRPEGVDELRHPRAAVLLLRPHQPRRPEAQGHQPPDRVDGHTRDRDPAAAPHQRLRRVRRGVLHRRDRAPREPRRWPRRRVAAHPGFARARTRRPVGGRRRPPGAEHRGARRPREAARLRRRPDRAAAHRRGLPARREPAGARVQGLHELRPGQLGPRALVHEDGDGRARQGALRARDGDPGPLRSRHRRARAARRAVAGSTRSS